jgi:AcrR family transcriptional regulator
MISGQDDGRTNQRLRTRRAIIDAAAALVRENRTPTVADAAERALVSRATAYRYFPSQQALLIEVQADASQPSLEDMLADVGDDPVCRVEVMARTLTRTVLADEPLYRNQLRAIQDLWFARQGESDIPVREGRRLAWIDEALKPVAGALPRARAARLRHALTAVIGVDAILGLRDIAGLGPKAIEDTLAWTAATIVRGAMSPD